MRLVAKILAVGLIVMPASALAGASSETVNEYAAVKTLGIISAVGKTVHVETTHMMRFDDSEYDADVGFDIDTYITQKIDDLLRAHFQITRLPAGTPAPAVAGLMGFASMKSRDEFTKMSATNPLDAYLIVYPNFVYPYNDTGFIIEHHKGLVKETTSVRFSYYIWVFNPKGERIDYGTANDPDIDSSNQLVLQCDNAIWAESKDALTDSQKGKIAELVKLAINRTLPFTLQHAGLISADEARSALSATRKWPDYTTCHPGFY